ncbi:hypothetical protein [Lysinibacillus sphaericus]|uniref:hypothetical protein n=1 Tax=Lysinibacillus sphaericus TaxID=1421 RepID=UPI003D05856A
MMGGLLLYVFMFLHLCAYHHYSSSTSTTDVMSTVAIVSLQVQDTAKQACSDIATSHSDTSCGSSFE